MKEFSKKFSVFVAFIFMFLINSDVAFASRRENCDNRDNIKISRELAPYKELSQEFTIDEVISEIRRLENALDKERRGVGVVSLLFGGALSALSGFTFGFVCPIIAGVFTPKISKLIGKCSDKIIPCSKCDLCPRLGLGEKNGDRISAAAGGMLVGIGGNVILLPVILSSISLIDKAVSQFVRNFSTHGKSDREKLRYLRELLEELEKNGEIPSEYKKVIIRPREEVIIDEKHIYVINGDETE